jgi:hypothetical protein
MVGILERAKVRDSSSSSRGDSSALKSRTSGTVVRMASRAASRESTTVTSAMTLSRMMRLTMAA